MQIVTIFKKNYGRSKLLLNNELLLDSVDDKSSEKKKSKLSKSKSLKVIITI